MMMRIRLSQPAHRIPVVVLDADCEYTLPDFTSDADLTVTECSTYEVTQNPVSGTIINDTTTVTLTVTDEYGQYG